jgi:autotransporter translocation and assembly factor TamB
MDALRRLIHVLVIVVTLVVGATAAAVIVSQTAWFKDWLRGYIAREANQYLNGQLTIDRLGGNIFFGIEMENVAVSMDGGAVVSVKDVGLDYNVFELVSRGMSVEDIRLNQPVMYLRQEGDSWSIARLIKRREREADREGPQYPIAIDNIGISNASVIVDQTGVPDRPVGTTGASGGIAVPRRFDHIDAKFSFHYEPVHYSIDITHVSFRGSDPEIGLNALSGGIAVKDDTLYLEDVAVRTEETSVMIDGAVQDYLGKPIVNLQISSDKTSLPEIARIVPALAGIRLQPAYELKLDGPLDQLRVAMNVRSSAGQAAGNVTTDLMMPGQSITGDVSVRHLDLGPILKSPSQRTDLTGNARVDLRAERLTDVDSWRGVVSVNAPRVVAAGYTVERVRGNARITGRRLAVNGSGLAYGAAATARGEVALPRDSSRSVSYDLRGVARNVDLRRLPQHLNVPPAATRVDTAYHIVGSGFSRTSGRTSDVNADLTLADSEISGAKVASGSTAHVIWRDGQLAYGADVTVQGADLQRIGRDFNIPALAADRYSSLLNGHATVSGRGTNRTTLDLTASGTLTDSTIARGRFPQLAFDTTLAGDTAHVKATGSFADVDPAVATGKPGMKGSAAGTLDVDATITGISSGVTLDNVEGTARLTLDPSTIGDLAITSGAVDADYRDRSADIRQLEIAGRDVNITASGTLALNDTGQSNLTFHADSPSLEEIGKILDRPLAGSAQIDGTITGNRPELQAKGSFSGSGLEYGSDPSTGLRASALTMTASYEARIPELAFEQATVVADTNATFVTVAGQNINELTAKTTYAAQRLEFDAVASQPQRSLTAAGALTIHPDHREVHLQRLMLDAQGQQWRLAPATEATIRYAGETIAVDHASLVSGDQRIDASGTFGRQGDALKVTMTNVDLAGVDALLLRPQQLAGRLDASGTVTGSREAPRFEGQFQVQQGAFRAFKYDALTGTIDYGGTTVAVDARLQQNPSQWVTAKGFLPVSLFRRTSAGAAPEAAIDFTIDSTPIDLGLIQGFTSDLTGVKGSFEAHVRVTGTVDDPQATGAITVKDGVVTVEPVGVTYQNIAGRVDLQGDRAHIDQLTILDNHDSAMTVTGDLGIGSRRVESMQLYVTSEDFKVVDNALGQLRIESQLEIGGDLTALHVTGYLGIDSGRLNLDEIIALSGPSPYPTEPIKYNQDLKAVTPDLGPFAALTLNVHVIVPNDLIVRADNLQSPVSRFGFGALNATLGGDVRATKDRGGPLQIVGAVNTVRGTYDFEGRRFEILRDGTIRFVGGEELNPFLDLRTRRIIQGVEARVNVRGTLRQPEIMLSSTPPLEEADILSLIVFNQPVNQLAEGQALTLAQRAQDLASGAITGQLAQSIGRVFNLDTFEIRMVPERGQAAEVTLGQQVGQNLYFKVQQAVGEHATTNFILEYELTEWLRLQSNILQGAATQQSLFRRAQGSGVDLIFFFSY